MVDAFHLQGGKFVFSDDDNIAIHEDCCCPCTACLDSIYPDEIDATFSGAIDRGCVNCDVYNRTYTLEKSGNCVATSDTFFQVYYARFLENTHQVESIFGGCNTGTFIDVSLIIRYVFTVNERQVVAFIEAQRGSEDPPLETVVEKVITQFNQDFPFDCANFLNFELGPSRTNFACRNWTCKITTTP